MSMLSTIRLNLSNKLKNRAFRRRFFKSNVQDDVAQQIRALRVKREMRQVDLAKVCKMKQSAVSRVEQANYSRWTFTTLLRIADALDARVRVNFDPAENVIAEYEERDKKIAAMAADFERYQSIADVINTFPDMQLGSAQEKSDLVISCPKPRPVTTSSETPQTREVERSVSREEQRATLPI